MARQEALMGVDFCFLHQIKGAATKCENKKEGRRDENQKKLL